MRFLLICCILAQGFADFSDYAIANELKNASKTYDIDKRVLYTLAKIESGFNPLIISFVDSHTNHYFKNLTKFTQKYGKNRYIISFSGNEADLKRALRILMEQGIHVDAGLMQINSINFSADEIDRIFSLSYNIQKSSEVLKFCVDRKRNVKDSIECYNKGVKNFSRYDYYNKFKKSYMNDFLRND